MTQLSGLRWWMMGLLILEAIINDLTRSTLAIAAPTVLKDLDISTQQYLACQDLSGSVMPADFDWFEYREREYVVDVSRLAEPPGRG